MGVLIPDPRFRADIVLQISLGVPGRRSAGSNSWAELCRITIAKKAMRVGMFWGGIPKNRCYKSVRMNYGMSACASRICLKRGETAATPEFCNLDLRRMVQMVMV